MKVSALIVSLLNRSDKIERLKKCVDSLVGYDELVVELVRGDFGFSESWNTAARLTHGDYVVFIGDNNVQTGGSLKDLCYPNRVLYPMVNNKLQHFHGFVFGMPRDLIERFGPYDMRFNEGCFWEDLDLYYTLLLAGIDVAMNQRVTFVHDGGGVTIRVISDWKEKQKHNEIVFAEKWSKIREEKKLCSV